jgi:hypothetical protein
MGNDFETMPPLPGLEILAVVVSIKRSLLNGAGAGKSDKNVEEGGGTVRR